MHIKQCLRHRSDAKALHVAPVRLLKRHWHKKQRQTWKSLITDRAQDACTHTYTYTVLHACIVYFKFFFYSNILIGQCNAKESENKGE